jgi:hypothetical protein
VNTCPSCGCEQGAGLLCAADTARLERDLGDVAAIVADLDVTLSKQAKIGTASGPGGLARERSPLNVGAMNVAGDLANTLLTWSRDVSGESWWPTEAQFMVAGGRTNAAAAYLLSRVDEIRRHPAVNELVDEISDAIAQARRVVDRPADRIYLGQCMVETPDDEGRLVTCLEEIWARPGASETTCKVCGTEHPVRERRAWLLKKAEDYLYTVKDASEMLGEVGHITVTQARIRGYIHRGKIGYRSGKLIRLGDLLEVLVDDSERRTAWARSEGLSL